MALNLVERTQVARKKILPILASAAISIQAPSLPPEQAYMKKSIATSFPTTQAPRMYFIPPKDYAPFPVKQIQPKVGTTYGLSGLYNYGVFVDDPKYKS